MAALYTLTDNYQALLDALSVAETEDEATAIWAQLDGLEEDITDKAEAYARIMRNKQAEAAACKAEIDRLTDMKRRAEAAVDHLKERMLDCLERTGASAIQTGIGKWYTQKNPLSCDVTDEAAIPKEFKIPQPDKIDKKAILAAFKDTGEIIPGTDVVQTLGIRFR